ncbi:replication-relaxation family protein [Longispora sp. NPDC051575]|uniref:replication-relaxation family protein n=1 Tax=Longispora sp. NPDC051575 TaxID=3154943 RepID=UPI003417EE07
MSRRFPRQPGPRPHSFTEHLTHRDIAILSRLAEHQILTTSQITRAFFDHPRIARRRLTILTRLEILDRFRFNLRAAGPEEYIYFLGLNGAAVRRPSVFGPDSRRHDTARSHRERVNNLLRSQRREHTLGANDFFTRLLADARASAGSRSLARWWSEQHATDAYGASGARIRPDGHGVWRAHGRSVGFWLEHDTGSEKHQQLLDKLPGYEAAARTGPVYPVLLWVPSIGRRDRLLVKLADYTRIPIAVAAHHPNPADPIWHLPGSGRAPLALHELPSDHGPIGATNPNRFDPNA